MIHHLEFIVLLTSPVHWKMAEMLAAEQLCLPRFFFQSLQTTSIKLAVTPQPRGNDPTINVNSSQHLAIKVEGVITSTPTAGMGSSSQAVGGPTTFRKIDSIKLTLNSTLQAALPTKQVKPGLPTSAIFFLYAFSSFYGTEKTLKEMPKTMPKNVWLFVNKNQWFA